MVESPVVNKIYKGPDINKYRDEKPENFLGGPVFVVKGFKNEKDRIAVKFTLFEFLLIYF